MKKQAYRATGTRFLIEKIEQENTTAMGIILKSSDEAPRATIISVGPQVKSSAEVGDVIIVDWTRVGHVTGTVFVVDETNVLAVVG